jgi:hypothetical protein
MSLRPDTIRSIARDGYGREEAAASQLIGCLAALSRDMDEDNRSIIAWTLLKLAAELDSAIQLRPLVGPPRFGNFATSEPERGRYRK